MTVYTTQQISDRVGGTLVGPADVSITGVSQLDQASPGQISFIRDAAFASRWPRSGASAALVAVSIDLQPGPERALVRVPDADLALAIVLEMFAPAPVQPPPGIDPSAGVDPTAMFGNDVRVGPHSVIGPGVVVGDGAVIHANVTILDGCRIGAGCVIWPGVVIRERCTLGDRCIIHPNATIGADGFNYRPDASGGGLVKIPHVGIVEIGADVEIGAGTCVDRGKFAATVIGQGTKIDNLCHIAHNCCIGRCCLLAGQVGLAGSVTVGDGVQMGGKVAIRDHVTIGDGATLTGCAAVMGDVPAGQVWGGVPAQEMRATMRQIAALRKLPDMIKAMKNRG